jgi:hypothetical protein
VRALMIAVVFLLLDLSVGPVVVRGEDLAKAAAREKERRAGTSGRVITEDDLAKAHQSAQPADESADQAGAASEASSSAATSGSPQAKSEEELRAERAKAWRERHDKLEQTIAQLEERIQQLQQTTGDRRVYQYGPNRARQIEALRQAEEQLALEKQRLEDLDEEGRREGF